MSILKRERGRYLLIEDDDTRRYLTNKEVYDLRRNNKLVAKRIGYKGVKARNINNINGRVTRVESVIAVPKSQMIVLNEDRMKQILEEDSSENRKKMKERFERASKRMVKR
jgi:hypothetical protein